MNMTIFTFVDPDEELAERIRDERDLNILRDIDVGHSEKDTAKRFNVTRRYVRTLKQAAAEAG